MRDEAELGESLEYVAGHDVDDVLRGIRERFYGSGEQDGSRWIAEKAKILMEAGA